MTPPALRATSPTACTDRGHREQVFGDMVNTLEEWNHEVFDAVPGEARGTRRAVQAGVGRGGESAGAVSAGSGGGAPNVKRGWGGLAGKGGRAFWGPPAGAPPTPPNRGWGR